MTMNITQSIRERLKRAAIDGRADLRDLQLRSLPSTIVFPDNLEYINFSRNQFTAIPEQVFQLERLRVLAMNDNALEVVPERLNSLKHLLRLEFNNNNINRIEEGFGRLPNLSTLYLGGNDLQTLPTSLRHAINLNVISLSRNPTGIPIEVLNGAPGALLNYLTAIETGEIFNLREAKLLIVGDGNSGKTRLTQSLATGTSDESTTTEGIEISRLKANSPDGEFSLNVWDFGGQEIYHATHQYFLTKKAIYVLVWVARSDDDLSSFDFWLSIVTLLSDSAPILVVQNKCDERRKEIDETRIREAFPNVVGFFDVSAKTGEGVPKLRDQILVEAQRLPHFNQAVPKAWLSIRSRLEKLNRPYVSYGEYLIICSDLGLPDDRAEWLSNYFNVLGVFLHFPDNMILADTLFLKPEWATNATYRLLDDPTVVEAHGLIDNKIARRAWADYPTAKHPVLLELLKRFELCFELGKGKGLILPARLPASRPEELETERPDISFFYEYDFMPAGVIERAIVRLNALIVGRLFWKGGAKLAKGGATAIIYADRFRRRILVDLVGKNKAELLTVIRNEIDHINSSLNNPIVRQMLPCNCEDCCKSEPYYFDYSEIQRAKVMGKKTIECRRSFEQVNIEGLIDRVDAKLEAKEDELLRLLSKVVDKFDDGESLATKANEIVRLQPNFFGVGVNLNYVISSVLKARKKQVTRGASA